MQRIVVGVDGSEHSRRALEWAIAEAKTRPARLTVVAAWELPTAVLASPAVALGYDPENWEKAAGETLDAALRSIDVNDLPAGLERQVVEGPAAKVLLDAGNDADLIVVGSRGRGGFAGLLLGSVSQQVAQHATRPVVIVPHER